MSRSLPAAALFAALLLSMLAAGDARAEACLAPEIEAAVEELSSGNLDTNPPLAEVADALAALELAGREAETRDFLVQAIRADSSDEFNIVFSAQRFRAEVPFRCPSASPQPSPDETANAAPTPGPTVGAPIAPGPADAGGGEPFAESIPTAAEVSTDPIVIMQSALLAALLVLLMPFPSQLFNSTLENHEDEVRRWFRLDRLGGTAASVGAFWASWPGVIVFTLIAALLYGFLDPTFGTDLASLATFLGMLVGIVLVTAAFAVPVVIAHRRHEDRPTIKVVPLSLLIGVACVLLSRLTGFQPGYLYGLLIGLAFARELSATEDGRATAIGAALMLAVAFGSWLLLGWLPEGEGFGISVVRTALAALMVAGLEGVVFGLLPMRFLPGESLYRWNRVLWAALLGIGGFAFFHILINPASGYLSDTSRTPLFTVLALLIGFSLASVAFWAWFRLRTEPDAAPAGDAR
jgi:MFS family permease